MPADVVVPAVAFLAGVVVGLVASHLRRRPRSQTVQTWRVR